MPITVLLLLSSLVTTGAAAGPVAEDYAGEIQHAISPARLRATHEVLAAEPHRAGTPGDRRVIDWLRDEFTRLGLEVEVQEFDTYLATPVSAHAELVTPVRRTLPLKERPLAEDPYSQRPGLSQGWNAYSGTGDVTAPVVYVNRGTLEDFKTLQRQRISLKGKIAIARYGGNFRGYKAKYAEEAGAVGLIIFSDPGDTGFARGPMWPDGGWNNPTTIQRGSISTLDYPGDPLTPGTPASVPGRRLSPGSLALPRIPVQPMGWAAAAEILSRLDGPPVPDDSWQGGLPFPYRLTGEGVTVRLAVRQSRGLVRTANVVATLRGASAPDQLVIIGAHHDAWEYGADDPLSGTIAVVECARAFAQAAQAGQRPARSVLFGCWGAEEFGIIGSTEWVEANEKRLTAGGVAYFNLDAAASGPRFGSASSPSLKAIIADAAARVPSAADPSVSALDEWRTRTETDPAELPRFGNLGGGSDHIGFYGRAGVPSAGLSAHGAPGTQYHSIYDDLAWYQRTVGDDYAPASMVAQITAVAAARLAAAPLVPLDLSRYAQDTLTHAHSLAERAKELDVEVDLTPLTDAANRFGAHAGRTQEALGSAVRDGRLAGAALEGVNALLVSFERLWLEPSGLTGRPWNKNLFAASDPTSGYAAWMFPDIRRAIEDRDPESARSAVERAASSLQTMNDALAVLDAMTPPQR